MATHPEVLIELEQKTPAQIEDFRRCLGHGSEECGPKEYADYLRKHPELEKAYCVLLELPTEEERARQATISAPRRDWLQVMVGVIAGFLTALAFFK